MTAAGHDSAIHFTLQLARALHAYGAPAHRLEEVLTLCSARLDMSGQFYSTPTAILASFAPDGGGTHLVRVQPGGVDLSKMVALNEVVEGILDGTLTPATGSDRIDAIVGARHPYGPALTTAGHAVACGTAARFFGGGLIEIAVAASLGLVIGLLAIAANVHRVARLLEFLAAVLAATVVYALPSFGVPVDAGVAVLASLIVLLPGLTFTVAMTELATRNLVSGTARSMGAATILLMLGFGVAIGSRIAALAGFTIRGGPIVPLPEWTQLVALLVAPLAFAVLFRARPRDVGWILAAGAVGFYGARAGSQGFGPELGTFLGALLVGVGSNVFARVLRRPSSITMLTGIILLVPGSIGFHSVEALQLRDVVRGVEQAFQMLLVAVSLVAGLLLANVVVSPRRSL